MKKIGLFTQEEIIEKCQENPRIKDGGSEFGRNISEKDHPFKFYELNEPQDLLEQIGRNPRFLREVCVFNSLAFINQEPDNGDRWWALKKYPDDTIRDFSNITFEGLIVSGWTHDGNVNEKVIKNLDAANSPEEVESIWSTYLETEKEMLVRAYESSLAEVAEDDMEYELY